MTDLILIAVGTIVIIVSFLISGQNGNEETKGSLTLTEEQLDECFDSLEPELRKKVLELFLDGREEAVVKTDDELLRISDEKKLELEDTSKQILEKINHNHQEVVFLYKMLNEKEGSLKELLLKIDQAEEKQKKTEKELLNRQKKIQLLQKKEQDRRVTLGAAEVTEQKLDQMLTETGAGKKNVKYKTDGNEFHMGIKEIDSPNQVTGQNHNHKILRMYREGKSIKEISQELSQGQGEVKLVIDLFEKKGIR